MNLGKLIIYLERLDPATVFPQGFTRPHSYRGYYEQLAFEPAKNVTAGAMLADARKALGATYQGYKGGEYRMSEWTDVNLAEWGSTGEPLSPMALEGMRLEGVEAELIQARAEIERLQEVCARLTDSRAAYRDDRNRRASEAFAWQEQAAFWQRAFNTLALAAEELVLLKDARPADYEERKPVAWAALRAALDAREP